MNKTQELAKIIEVEEGEETFNNVRERETFQKTTQRVLKFKKIKNIGMEESELQEMIGANIV